MREIAAVLSLLNALAVLLLPADTPQFLISLLLMLIFAVSTAALEPRPGHLSVVCLLGWFSAMIASPFSQTGQFNGGEDDNFWSIRTTEGLLTALQPYNHAILLFITVLYLGIFIWRARLDGDVVRFLEYESEGLGQIVTKFGMFAAFLFVPIMLFIVYDVVQKKYVGLNPDFTSTDWFTHFSSTRLQELQWHLHSMIFLLSLGFVYTQNAHVRIELFSARLQRRSRIWIEIIGCVFFLIPYCYVIIDHGLVNVGRSYALMERSSATTGLPYRYLVKSLLPIGFSLLALAGLSVVFRCIAELANPRLSSNSQSLPS